MGGSGSQHGFKFPFFIIDLNHLKDNVSLKEHATGCQDH